MQVGAGATLYGGGTITADVANNGTVTVGGYGSNTVANLSVQGGYTQANTAALDMALAGSSSAYYDTLTVSGPTALAGTLNVQFYNGFAPYAGQWFELMPGATTGQFAAVNAPVVNGVTLTPQ